MEDDVKLTAEISKYLINYGFDCQVAFDGTMLLKIRKEGDFNLYLLDISVPLLNGIEVCRIIRQDDKSTPILMLTALDDVSEKVQALEAGADDYLVKPFYFTELIARINALLRRSKTPQSDLDILCIDNLKINFSTGLVERGGNLVKLTETEFRLLVLLARANGKVVAKNKIISEVWNNFSITDAVNMLGVYINFLRNKIDKDQKVKLIHTKTGFGYYMNIKK